MGGSSHDHKIQQSTVEKLSLGKRVIVTKNLVILLIEVFLVL